MNYGVSGPTPSSNRLLADIKNKELFSEKKPLQKQRNSLLKKKLESFCTTFRLTLKFAVSRKSFARKGGIFGTFEEGQPLEYGRNIFLGRRSSSKIFGGFRQNIGGKAIDAELLEVVAPVDKDWRESAEIEGATRVFSLRDFTATSLEEFKFFKAHLERTLEFCEIAKWELEALEIMLCVNREDLIFRFSSISAAKLVKDALESLGYALVYEKDPCEGGLRSSIMFMDLRNLWMFKPPCLIIGGSRRREH
ncbi:hypothetical protein RUND412_002067 [Rhizina undulata]